VEKSLDQVHKQHITLFEDLSTKFEQQLDILHEAEEPLQASFAAELVRIPIHGAISEDKESEFEVLTLQQRAIQYQKLLKTKHKAVTALIEEWNKIQVDIIALAAEILGHEKVVVDTMDHPDAEKEMNHSKVKHKQAEDKFQEMLSKILDLEQQAAQLTTETKETMHKQQQVCNVIHTFDHADTTL
jgi:hypothetical protein